jgi:septum formation protein
MSQLILASTSPRRKKILGFLGLSFKAMAPRGVEEKQKRGEVPERLVRRLALEKARSIHRAYPKRWVLGADTLVVQRGIIYGKPQNREEALRTLENLSGNPHEVLTGFALLGPGGKVFKGMGKSRVFFKPIQKTDLQKYVSSSEPYDKAGGYDIRGTALGWIERLEGDYFNVMGLPVPELLQALARAGIP